MESETLAETVARIGTALLRDEPRTQQVQRQGLRIERVGIGGTENDPTIDVFISGSADTSAAAHLGDLIPLLERLPPDLWRRVRVLDAQGGAALLAGEVIG